MLRCHELVVLFDHCDLLGHRLGNNRLLQEADVLMCGQPLCWTLESVVWGWETKANSTSVSNVCLLKDIPNTWRIVDVLVNLRNFARHLCWYALLTYCFFSAEHDLNIVSTIQEWCRFQWFQCYAFDGSTRSEIGVASFWAYGSPSSSTWVYQSCGTARTLYIMVLVRFVDGGDTRWQKSCSEKTSSCILK